VPRRPHRKCHLLLLRSRQRTPPRQPLRQNRSKPPRPRRPPGHPPGHRSARTRSDQQAERHCRNPAERERATAAPDSVGVCFSARACGVRSAGACLSRGQRRCLAGDAALSVRRTVLHVEAIASIVTPDCSDNACLQQKAHASAPPWPRRGTAFHAADLLGERDSPSELTTVEAMPCLRDLVDNVSAGQDGGGRADLRGHVAAPLHRHAGRRDREHVLGSSRCGNGSR